MNQHNQGLLFGAIGTTIFALTLPATRYLVEFLNPVFIGLGRSLFAALIAFTLLLATRQPWPSFNQFRRLGIVALGVIFGFPVLSAISMQTLEAAHGGVVLAILPLATAAAATLITTERPSLSFWLLSALGTALVIVYSVLQTGNPSGAPVQLADIVLMLAVVSAAVGYAVGGKLAHELGGWQVICWALVIALPFLVLPTLFIVPLTNDTNSSLVEVGLSTVVSSLPSSAWLSFFYLTFMSQLFGFFFWYRGLALGGIAKVSQLQLLQPFITIIASAWLLHETVNSLTFGFAAAVVAVVAFSKRTTINRTSD